jgi:hypothetical protein
MSAIYNPWADPFEDVALPTGFVTAELESPELPMEQPADQLAAALEVINQQSAVIQQLVAAMHNE